VTPKEAVVTAAPNTVRTTVMTHALAAITDRRAGTAVNVVRMRPVLYSPVIARAPMEEILAAIRVVAAGDALIAPAVTRRLIERFAGLPEPVTGPRDIDGITGRERHVLTLIGRGLSNTEIAAELTISLATVKTYVTRLLAKLDARDRVQLVIIAYNTGLVTPAP
jgi:DNA-binding NarL/FixJ family response regulator